MGATHSHVKLKGKIWSPELQKWVFRTKLAQVYPPRLCLAMARPLCLLFSIEPPALWPTFELALPASDRKRPLGQTVPYQEHRQAVSGKRARDAGYQMKRGVLPPLFEVELEAGQAVKLALQVLHPFTEVEALEPQLRSNIEAVAQQPAAIIDRRLQLLSHWGQRAVALLPTTAARIRQLSDPHLKRLLWGRSLDEPATLGSITHLALWEELLAAAQSPDTTLVDQMTTGMAIIGPIAKSGRWPPLASARDVKPESYLLKRAWEIRRKVIGHVQATRVSNNLRKIWEASVEDVHEASALGPFYREEEVTSLLEDDSWVPTQRFEVVQKNKVRGCDSATVNFVNVITEIQEKLQLPSTDTNVAALRLLMTQAQGDQLAGWVLDERKAYRQVPPLQARPTSALHLWHGGSEEGGSRFSSLRSAIRSAGSPPFRALTRVGGMERCPPERAHLGGSLLL